MGLILPAETINNRPVFSLARCLTPAAVAAPLSWADNCPVQTAYINRVATAVPPYDVLDAFRLLAQSLLDDER
jgi:hypothetical protein